MTVMLRRLTVVGLIPKSTVSCREIMLMTLIMVALEINTSIIMGITRLTLFSSFIFYTSNYIFTYVVYLVV
ncbi:hypothetical protein CBFG_06121 [Clostridiales bacterium 1_7_47FAA]|nr:hypothetical protein CBFG_06121 [Clostridiales bacterium 1_7_47FAA]